MQNFTFHSVDKKVTTESNLTDFGHATDLLERGYAAHRDLMAHIGRYMHISSFITKVKKPVKILDVGAGKLPLPYTINHNRIASKVESYWALEGRATEKYDSLLTWKVPTTVVHVDIVDCPIEMIESLPGWPEDGFDVVVCTEVLEHVPRDKTQELVDRLYRWTNQSGVCFLSTPNLGTSRSVAKNHVGSEGIRERTYDEKIEIVDKAGFTVQKTYGTFIRKSQIPTEFFENELVKVANEYLHSEWFSVFAAAAFPDLANNSIFVMTK